MSVAIFSRLPAQQLLGPAPRDTSQDERFNESSLAACAPREAKAPALAGAFLTIGSLTMTYFHTGIRTIIGAESFHCPVRDGKEWDQLAMVIRLKRFLTWFALGRQPDQSIRRVDYFISFDIDCVSQRTSRGA